MDVMPGKKTYGVAALMAVYAVSGWWLGRMPDEQVGHLILEAMGLMALRLGIKKAE